jgi:hypothetical protein
MSGGITQLVAIGAQDAWLTGKPEVSFFRNNYKRHTNFAHVVQRQVIQGAVNASGMSSIRLERRGDMVSYVYLTKKNSNGAQVKFSDLDIDHIDFLIGGQVIDSQTHEFMAYAAAPYLSSTQNKASYDETRVGYEGYAYPLRFWFCENWQSALPLIALQYHDVEIRIYWASTVNQQEGAPFIYEAWANFIVLDTVEREDFASRTQNHLIYQVQKATPSGNKTQNLVFNHPVKFIMSINDQELDTSNVMLLQINGVDIGEQKTITPHFNFVPNYYSVPFQNSGINQFLIPFCLDTSKLQPTGTLNFSRIDSARLVSSKNFTDDQPEEGPPGLGNFYAVNYNILKIENGMGGLMYAN